MPKKASIHVKITGHAAKKIVEIREFHHQRRGDILSKAVGGTIVDMLLGASQVVTVQLKERWDSDTDILQPN